MKFCPNCAEPLATKIVDGESRFACHTDCGFVFWNNPIPAAAALIEINGEYLLARNKAWPEGYNSLIAGFIEANESPEQAIVRETKEELGLEAVEVEFVAHYPFAKMNQLMICFVVKAEGEIKLNDELADYILLSKQQLIDYDFGELFLGRLVVDKWLSL